MRLLGPAHRHHTLRGRALAVEHADEEEVRVDRDAAADRLTRPRAHAAAPKKDGPSRARRAAKQVKVVLEDVEGAGQARGRGRRSRLFGRRPEQPLTIRARLLCGGPLEARNVVERSSRQRWPDCEARFSSRGASAKFLLAARCPFQVLSERDGVKDGLAVVAVRPDQVIVARELLRVIRGRLDRRRRQQLVSFGPEGRHLEFADPLRRVRALQNVPGVRRQRRILIKRHRYVPVDWALAFEPSEPHLPIVLVVRIPPPVKRRGERFVARRGGLVDVAARMIARREFAACVERHDDVFSHDPLAVSSQAPDPSQRSSIRPVR
mmetsp:Transcript_10364/g.31870  ORF Transcript_10364/g.31870 Transcript_10364/m.31870 type:complete len:322 (+) Transcript_10364:154-1119(+)